MRDPSVSKSAPSFAENTALFGPHAPPFSICVYCASQQGRDPIHSRTAHAVGDWIGRHGGQLVYGGSHAGLMGILADATLQAGGRVVGIIPKALVDREFAHHGCTELHIVDNMHQRKFMMAERATAFLALSGGIGTFEEFFEAWTWRQLGYHHKPVALLNTAGYYDTLLQFLEGSVTAGFMRHAQMEMIHVGTEVPDVLHYLAGPTEARVANAAGNRLDMQALPEGRA